MKNFFVRGLVIIFALIITGIGIYVVSFRFFSKTTEIESTSVVPSVTKKVPTSSVVAQREEEPLVFVKKVFENREGANLYKGFVILEGTYEESSPEGMGGGMLTFMPDKQYREKLPQKGSSNFILDEVSTEKIKIDNSVFDNKAICKLSVKAKIAIDGFTEQLLEAEVWNRATLVQVLSVSPQTTETCESLGWPAR
ncbi:MAG: hypothetical protein WCG73_00330 [Candidatus Moraniibacteriota bacterium]